MQPKYVICNTGIYTFLTRDKMYPILVRSSDSLYHYIIDDEDEQISTNWIDGDSNFIFID